MTNDNAQDRFGERLAGMSEEACDAEFQAILQKLSVDFAKLQAPLALSDPLEAMRGSMGLLERMLKIQLLMRKAYPKRARPARRLRRRGG
jgi:hypothetical protein